MTLLLKLLRVAFSQGQHVKSSTQLPFGTCHAALGNEPERRLAQLSGEPIVGLAQVTYTVAIQAVAKAGARLSEWAWGA